LSSELEKLDSIRERLDVTYEEARRALDEAGGDVVEALTSLERSRRDLLSVVIELANEVNRFVGSEPAKRVRIRFGRRVIADIPVAFSAAAGFLMGLAAVLITKAAIELDRETKDD